MCKISKTVCLSHMDTPQYNNITLIPFACKDNGAKWVLLSGIGQIIISLHPFENLLHLYFTFVDLLHGLVGYLTLIFKADLLSLLIDG